MNTEIIKNYYKNRDLRKGAFCKGLKAGKSTCCRCKLFAFSNNLKKEERGMKKAIIFLCVAGLFIFCASPMWAGGIVNKQNLSTEYIGSVNRNAATDSADITVFNPAGVMKMENGTYVNLTVMQITKDYSNDIAGYDELEQDEPSTIPGFFAVYKQDKWAGFFAVTIPGGGGLVDFAEGSQTTYDMAMGLIAHPLLPFDTLDSMELEAESVYTGYTFGGAFEINNMISVSAGLRYIDAFKNIDGTVVLSVGGLGSTPFNVEVEQEASGWGGFLGVNIAPMDELNIGVRFETNTKLDFETDLKNDTIPGGGPYVDGAKEREDLPGLLGIGASYKITPEFKLGFSYTYYLEKSADWEGRLKDAGNSWDFALGADYAFTPALKASLGFMMTRVSIDTEDLLSEAPELDANSIAAGLAWNPMEQLTLNFGIIKVMYDSETKVSEAPVPSSAELDKDSIGIAVGVQYRF
ncbi:MAG: outer membrane protein transport protein [Deltaproteobacteria bacterium]|nr:outer membrane protein transport protein [Deltaproteobacteria bacterium]